MGIWREKVEAVVDGEKESDDDGLGDLDAVDAGQYVDTVGAKNGNGSHVEIVEDAKVKQVPKVGS